jgi:hypothetical protein
MEMTKDRSDSNVMLAAPTRLRPPIQRKETGLVTADNAIVETVNEKAAITKKEFFCRNCDRRVSGDIPAGWYRLARRIVRYSLQPPPVDAPKRAARRLPEMPMGLYCSISCLKAAMGRLTAVDWELTKRGIGLKALVPGSLPVKLPAMAKRGIAQ